MEEIIHFLSTFQFRLARLEMSNLQTVADCGEFFGFVLDKPPQPGGLHCIIEKRGHLCPFVDSRLQRLDTFECVP